MDIHIHTHTEVHELEYACPGAALMGVRLRSCPSPCGDLKTGVRGRGSKTTETRTEAEGGEKRERRRVPEQAGVGQGDWEETYLQGRWGCSCLHLLDRERRRR